MPAKMFCRAQTNSRARHTRSAHRQSRQSKSTVSVLSDLAGCLSTTRRALSEKNVCLPTRNFLVRCFSARYPLNLRLFGRPGVCAGKPRKQYSRCKSSILTMPFRGVYLNRPQAKREKFKLRRRPHSLELRVTLTANDLYFGVILRPLNRSDRVNNINYDGVFCSRAPLSWNVLRVNVRCIWSH